MGEVMGATGRRATDISNLTVFIDNKLGLPRVAFLFTGIVGLLSLIIARPLNGLFRGINQRSQIGIFAEGLVNSFALSAFRRLRPAQACITHLA